MTCPASERHYGRRVSANDCRKGARRESQFTGAMLEVR